MNKKSDFDLEFYDVTPCRILPDPQFHYDRISPIILKVRSWELQEC